MTAPDDAAQVPQPAVEALRDLIEEALIDDGEEFYGRARPLGAAWLARIITADREAFLAYVGHDNCVPAQHCERCGIRMVATPDKDVDNALIRAERAEAERDRLREAIRAHRDGCHETIGMADLEARDTRRGELDAALWAALDGGERDE